MAPHVWTMSLCTHPSFSSERAFSSQSSHTQSQNQHIHNPTLFPHCLKSSVQLGAGQCATGPSSSINWTVTQLSGHGLDGSLRVVPEKERLRVKGNKERICVDTHSGPCLVLNFKNMLSWQQTGKIYTFISILYKSTQSQPGRAEKGQSLCNWCV